MKGNELSHRIDVIIPEGLAPVDAAMSLRAAIEEGCRCVHVPAALANAAHAEAKGRCHVAITCEHAIGWPGNSLLMHAGVMLAGANVDELDIPVEASLLGDEAWLASQLRRVTQLCHAHGAFANVTIDVTGMAEKDGREVVRAVRRTSANALVLAGATAIQVAASVDESRGALPIQVACSDADPVRLLSLGASSVRIEAMSPCNEDRAA